MRKIIHIDMDAFYASVEQRDNRFLRGKPIVVGRDVPRGVVATASYEARKFGVHSAMSVQRAKKLCKDLIIIPPRFDVYKQVSQEIREIFHKYTDIIEPVSLDEAFLDVTANKRNMDLAMDIAKQIKNEIFYQTFLTSSAGVSYNKFLAKIASDWNKPNGLKVIHPSQAQKFIDNLNVEKIWGVGPKTLQKMHLLGVSNCKQLKELSLLQLTEHFGKMGKVFYDYARGIDNSEVVSSWKRKSVTCEHTLEMDISERMSIIIELYNVVLDLVSRINKNKFKGKCLTLKIKYYDFTIQTRSLTQREILDSKDKILPLAKKLMKKIPYRQKPIRLIGLGVSGEDKTIYKEPELFE